MMDHVNVRNLISSSFTTNIEILSTWSICTCSPGLLNNAKIGMVWNALLKRPYGRIGVPHFFYSQTLDLDLNMA